MDRHALAPTVECQACGWPSGPTCAHCGHQRGRGADGGGTRVVRDVAGIDRPLWDEWEDVILVPVGVASADAIRRLLAERYGR